ncbi:MAG: rRNA adenine dimethyltransferase family protein [Candidatus Absconditabacteria bacterium]|nr:rRNA adenine dimethyltransferase family protein [Candidatus Absconditabacteria bacterium]
MGTYLGQNFLTDTKIRHYLGNKIKDIYEKSGCEVLIEIGPGKGSLTKLIHEISPEFFVIERDNNLIAEDKLKVEGLENVRVIHADVLDVDVNAELQKRGKEANKTLVVGNLPYYITSPILRKFFGEGQQDYVGGVFMVQKEVADKLCTDAAKKSYLWWITNFAYDVIYLKTVPAKAFSPAPKVTSALIELRRKNLEINISFNKLLNFLEDFAPYSRKTLRSIATMLKKKKGKERNIPKELEGERLEKLSWGEIGEILR